MTDVRKFAAILVAAVILAGCAGMTDQQQRMATGAAIGGVAAGAVSGKWGWGLAGAAVGAGTGHLIDAQQQRQNQREQDAFQRGVEQGRSQ